MDFATSHVFYCVLLLLGMLGLVSMALADRLVVGARWMAVSVGLELGKTLLQGIDGGASRYLTVMAANELNFLAFCAMYLGFRWFVWRRPFRSSGPIVAALAMLFLYAAMFQEHCAAAFEVQGAFVLWICGCSAALLLQQKEARFRLPGRVTGILLLLHMGMLSYRMVVAALPSHARLHPGGMWADPRWMYSMLVVLLLGACLLGTYLWMTAAEMTANVAEVAELDALTGSWNRRALTRRATVLVARSMREGRPLAMVALEVDFFKLVNDRFGHAAGDAVLCAIVEAAAERMRAKDVIARMGGEEFLLLLPDLDAVAAAAVAERVRSDIERLRVETGQGTIGVTVSLGVAEMLPENDSWPAMMGRADGALARAKECGRNRVLLDGEVAARLRRPVLVVNQRVERRDPRPYLVR